MLNFAADHSPSSYIVSTKIEDGSNLKKIINTFCNILCFTVLHSDFLYQHLNSKFARCLCIDISLTECVLTALWSKD